MTFSNATQKKTTSAQNKQNVTKELEISQPQFVFTSTH